MDDSHYTGNSHTSGQFAEPHYSTVGSASDSRARGPGLGTRSSHILSFLLPLIQEGQLSVTMVFVMIDLKVQEQNS